MGYRSHVRYAFCYIHTAYIFHKNYYAIVVALSAEKFGARYFLADNSSSMGSEDGHKLAQVSKDVKKYVFFFLR